VISHTVGVTPITVYRDDDGRWHITAPDGTIIC